MATKIRAHSAKSGEQQTTIGTISSQWASEKEVTPAGNMQMTVRTDLLKSLVKAMEEQKQTHANQIETLLTQIDTLQTPLTDMSTQVADLTEEVRTQAVSMQAPSPSPSYAEVACTPPSPLYDHYYREYLRFGE